MVYLGQMQVRGAEAPDGRNSIPNPFSLFGCFVSPLLRGFPRRDWPSQFAQRGRFGKYSPPGSANRFPEPLQVGGLPRPRGNSFSGWPEAAEDRTAQAMAITQTDSYWPLQSGPKSGWDSAPPRSGPAPWERIPPLGRTPLRCKLSLSSLPPRRPISGTVPVCGPWFLCPLLRRGGQPRSPPLKSLQKIPIFSWNRPRKGSPQNLLFLQSYRQKGIWRFRKLFRLKGFCFSVEVGTSAGFPPLFGITWAS